jgi:hypothetical protein
VSIKIFIKLTSTSAGDSQVHLCSALESREDVWGSRKSRGVGREHWVRLESRKSIGCGWKVGRALEKAGWRKMEVSEGIGRYREVARGSELAAKGKPTVGGVIKGDKRL